MFAWLAIAVSHGSTQSFDTSILLAFRRPDGSLIGTPAIQQSAKDVTALGSNVVLGILTASIAGFLALNGRRRLGVLLAVAIVGGGVCDFFLKDAFLRPRPELVPHAVYAYGTSFPSGHSMLSALTYLTLGMVLARSQRRWTVRLYVLTAAILLTAMVGVTRVYLGVHWPTDVLAGWAAGAVWALAWSLVLREDVR